MPRWVQRSTITEISMDKASIKTKPSGPRSPRGLSLWIRSSADWGETNSSSKSSKHTEPIRTEQSVRCGGTQTTWRNCVNYRGKKILQRRNLSWGESPKILQAGRTNKTVHLLPRTGNPFLRCWLILTPRDISSNAGISAITVSNQDNIAHR